MEVGVYLLSQHMDGSFILHDRLDLANRFKRWELLIYRYGWESSEVGVYLPVWYMDGSVFLEVRLGFVDSVEGGGC